MCDISYADQILTGLKVIGMIREGQKVSVRNGLLNIDDRKRGVISGLVRWLNNDNRYNTLSYIRNIVNNALEISSKYPEHKPMIDDGLARAVTGLTSLSVTYSDDASVSATIDVMKERIINYKNNL